MSFGLGINGALEGASKGTAIGSAIPGLGTTVGGIVGGGLGLLSGLFGSGNSTKQQKELMDKAWEYEKEGMGMQYEYGQAAANAAQKRNMEMWNQTNFGAQRQHMEDAGLSVGLMYGGGGQGAVSQGGQATQPSGPTSNPVTMALQYQQIEQQNEAIKSQTMLNQAEAAKALAEAKKTGGVDTRKTESEIKWQEIENRIQESREQINVLDSRFYRRNGKYYPSVTSILNFFPKNQFFHSWLKDVGHNSDIIAAKAAGEGTQVHNAVEAFLNGEEITWIDEWGNAAGYRDWETDRKSTRLNSSHRSLSRMPSSA